MPIPAPWVRYAELCGTGCPSPRRLYELRGHAFTREIGNATMQLRGQRIHKRSPAPFALADRMIHQEPPLPDNTITALSKMAHGELE
jgi:hypothetical protein